MAARRPRLAQRRKFLGYSQESLAEDLGADRSTVARWERGDCDPMPYHRPKLFQLLQVTPAELDALLTPEMVSPEPADPGSGQALAGRVLVRMNEDDPHEMNRRELLQLLSVAGALVTVPTLDVVPAAAGDDIEQLDSCERLNSHLWQVFSLSTAKRLTYPAVRQQITELTTCLHSTHSQAAHQRLCALAADVFQLAGEIFFDGDQYTEAAHCYTVAADAAKEARAWDLWACALTRHAYLGIYERRYATVVPLLEAASRIARRGDSHRSTRYWVAAVQAEAYAGLGELDACRRSLGAAEQVKGLTGPVAPGGWLRFDGDRLADTGAGTCYRQLGELDLAEQALNTGLAQVCSPRRRGSLLTDLAVLGVARRDVDQVLQYADEAIQLADQTRSSGYVGRKLLTLQAELTPLLPNHRIAQLNDRIAQL